MLGIHFNYLKQYIQALSQLYMTCVIVQVKTPIVQAVQSTVMTRICQFDKKSDKNDLTNYSLSASGASIPIKLCFTSRMSNKGDVLLCSN